MNSSSSSLVITAKDEPKSVTRVAIKPPHRFGQWLRIFEWLVIALLTVTAICLHFRFVTNVGGLWRDEANSVQVATLPHFAEIWRSLEFDSFPLLFFGILRAWTAVFGQENDAALRALGFIIGLGVLAALWLNAHRLGARAPVLSLALVGLNPMLIRYGDSTRAYGIGILLILLVFWSYWRLVQTPSPNLGKIALAGVFALLSVQCLYYNSVLLLAISAGAIAVALRTRAWRTIAIILTIGMLAAASLLPYLPMMRRMHEWTFLVSFPVTLPWLWLRICEVLSSPDPIAIWLWTGAFFVGLIAVVSLGIRRQMPSPILFAAVSCLVAIPVYAVFLRVLSYYTQPWYYITLTILVACCLDILLGSSRDEAASTTAGLLRGIRLLLAVALLSLATLPAWDELPTRHTNVDLVAATLRTEATRDDVIIATHWQYAVSLARYYHGPAEIITLPPIADHRFHRYDLALQQMRKPDPLEPIYVQVEQVLRSGHRAFLIGALPYPRPGVRPPVVSLGYRETNGTWHGGNYDVVWPVLAGYFVYAHAKECRQIPVPIPNRGRVQRHEHLALSVIAGWR